MKKIIASLLFAIFTCSLIANAASNHEFIGKFDEKNLKKLSVVQLQMKAKECSNDTEAMLVFEELLSRVAVTSNKANGYPAIAAAPPSTLIETYISATGASITNNTLSVTYRVIAQIPSALNMRIGFEYSPSLRVTGSYYMPASQQGSYTATFSNLRYICNITAQIKINIPQANTVKYIKTLPNLPIGSKIEYHEVTATEAVASFLMVEAAGAIIKYGAQSVGVSAECISTFAKGYTAVWGVGAALAWSIAPGLQKGQYYKTEVSYDSKYMYIATTIWTNKQAFQTSSVPIYKGTQKYGIV